MPNPGSSHALVLPSASDAPDATVPSGQRAVELLQPFLDSTKYTAIAVVHGLGDSTPKAFDLAKQRLTRGRGLVWLTDPDLRGQFTGPNDTILKQLLKPVDGYVMTFFSVKNQRVTGKLKWFKLNLAEVDLKYIDAGLN